MRHAHTRAKTAASRIAPHARTNHRTRAAYHPAHTRTHPFHRQKANAMAAMPTGVGLPARMRSGKMSVRLA